MAFSSSKITKKDVFAGYRPAPRRGKSVNEANEERGGSGLGRIFGITGSTGAGKSSIAASTGWLNLEYKHHLDNDITGIHFPKVIKLMQKGIINEVEKIGVIDSDLKILDDSKETDWKKKFGPLFHDNRFDVTEVYLTSVISDEKGKIHVNYEILEDDKYHYESTWMNYLNDDNVNVVINDCLTDYCMILLAEAMKKYPAKETWFWYGERKRGLFHAIKPARASKKMHWFIFRMKEELEFRANQREEQETYDLTFEEPWYKIRWPGETGYKIDNFYLALKNYKKDKYYVKQKKGPWAMVPRKMELPDDPFQFPRILEASADVLLEEYDHDKFEKGEKFW